MTALCFFFLHMYISHLIQLYPVVLFLKDYVLVILAEVFYVHFLSNAGLILKVLIYTTVLLLVGFALFSAITEPIIEAVDSDVDLLAAIAEDQGFEYELQSLGWDAGVAAVQAGQADALIAGATIKQERIDSGWIFSDGYYNATQTFVVSEDSDIASYEDLKGKNVAVKNGTAGADFANSLKDEYGFTVTVFEDSPTMYQDVILGNSAACVEDTPIMAASIKEGNLALKIPEGMESDGAPYGLAIMDEKNQELLDMFNKGLEDIKANGTYDEIIAKYLGE